MGAVLYFVGKPLMFWADGISDEDLSLLRAERIPDFQTDFEMYTIFLSLKLFLPLLPQPFAIFLRADNSASLHACLTFKAKSPLLTHLTAEFLLEFLWRGWTPPSGEHVAGVPSAVEKCHPACHRSNEWTPLSAPATFSEPGHTPRPQKHLRHCVSGWPD